MAEKVPAANKNKTTAKKTTAAEKKTTAAKKTTAVAEKKTAAPKSTAAKAPAAQKSKTTAKSTAPALPKAVAPAAPAIKRARPLRRAPVAQGSAQDAPAHSWRRSRRRTRVGVVTSAKQAHTVTVVVERMREHPLYKKVIRLRKKYAAHDAAGDVKAGDLVRIQESRPFSATKHWQVVEVLSRAGEAGAAAPRAVDVEKYLEQAEGVDVILAPPREAAAEPVAEGTVE
ncbi:MAG TPA: 30S ribosomal protein S17 [Candidatus Limnocylindria bacterium]|nr:30S ribosomal protein S17 [Candidatus Limnocylindria bacterium]